MQKLLIQIALVGGILSGSAMGATQPADTNFQRFGGVPVVAFSEETGLQYGFLGLVFFRSIGPKDPGSQLDVAAIGTTEHQQRFVFSPTVALLNGDARLELELQYKNWPGKYWSGGNSPSDSALSYDMSMWLAEGNLVYDLDGVSFLSKALQKNLKVGLEFAYENNTTKFLLPDSASYANDPASFPVAPPPVARQGGLRNGLGWALQWDARDHDNWPRSGTFAWVRQVFFNKAIGSDHDFINTKVDLRGFVPTPLEGAFGMAAYFEGLMGKAPFDRLAMPDGTYRLRGLEKGRLRDRQQVVLQGEWRVPLFWRFQAAAFGEAGKVGPYFAQLMRNDFHYAAGVGGRFALNTKRRVNVRGDLSWVDGGIGMTIYFKEAF